MESPLILNPDKCTVLFFHCDTIRPLQTLSISLISLMTLAVMATLALPLLEHQPWQKPSWKSYLKSTLSFLIKEEVLAMVSCLKANLCNCVLDSCSSMHSQLESMSFVLCPGCMPHTPDTQLVANYAPSSPEHPPRNSLCLLSTSLQDMSHFYAWIDSIQICNVNIFQALCPVLCADVIKGLTRMQLASIDSTR